MATTTEHYGLATGVVADDFIQPEHNNRPADVLDRVVWNALSKLLADGAYGGWLIQNDKAVAPGEGLADGCWCETVSDQGISGLTNGAVNYVFGETDATSAPDGTIAFYASTSPTKPSGHVYLGTIELDGNGDVVAIDNEADDVDRNLYRLEVVTLKGSGEEQGLGPGQDTTVEISHDALRLVGGITFSCQPPEVTYEISEHHRRDAFKVKLTNTGGSAVDVTYQWEREGVKA